MLVSGPNQSVDLHCSSLWLYNHRKWIERSSSTFRTCSVCWYRLHSTTSIHIRKAVARFFADSLEKSVSLAISSNIFFLRRDEILATNTVVDRTATHFTSYSGSVIGMLRFDKTICLFLLKCYLSFITPTISRTFPIFHYQLDQIMYLFLHREKHNCCSM